MLRHPARTTLGECAELLRVPVGGVQMTITGTLDTAGRDLVLTRVVAAPAARIWEHVSRSALLATWYGAYTGDPASGSVQVTMTAEPGEASTSDYTIHACEPGRLLTVSASMEGTWTLSLELTPDADGGTQVARTMQLLQVTSLAELTPAHVTQLERLAPRPRPLP